MRIHVTDSRGRVHSVEAEEDLTVSQAVFLSGDFPVRALCSGAARCGRCKVKYLSEPPGASADERFALSPEELGDGWRLACRRRPAPGDRLLVPERPAEERPDRRALTETDAALSALAVDLGTTSIQWSAGNGQREVLAGAMLNPQLGAGSEIMSRLAFAAEPGRAGQLRELTVGALRSIVDGLPSRPGRMCVAGNQAMTCLLLGRSLDSIARAPYALSYAGGEWLEIAPELPEAYLPPQLSAFIGGDASAGVVALEFAESAQRPWLLADLGTNGEFVLALPGGGYLAASVPMGPALEGVGMSCGGLAAEGVATSFEMTSAGLAASHAGGRLEEPSAIAGAGYLSLVSLLLAAGVLDVRGAFRPSEHPLGRAIAQRTGPKGLALPGGLSLAPRDVEELLKVKAACNLAVERLLAESGLRPPEVVTIFLGGALGSHLPPRHLEGLGFFPSGWAGRCRAAGNTSLAGARLFLALAEAREFAERLPERTRVTDLVSDPGFSRAFVSAMCFEYVSGGLG